MKLCIATATHNFKWVKIMHICFIWDETSANLDVQTHISFPISMIWWLINRLKTTIVVTSRQRVRGWYYSLCLLLCLIQGLALIRPCRPYVYCWSDNISKILFFANFTRRTNSRIQKSHGNYYYTSATKEKGKLANSKLSENLITRKLPDLQYCWAIQQVM